MPTVQGGRNLLSAGAGYNAGDWANVGAEASLDLLAVANLNRGVDIGLGVEALARLDGAIRQYIAADVNGQAHAAARVRAQVQMPLDLFDEAGIAVRLQAIAEAAVGVELGIGLDVGSFLALAGNDPRLRGAPLAMLKIFLDELSVEGGVMAKAAASAMAYANLVATGSFVKRGPRPPGFIVAAEAGVGLKAGAGFRVFARFGVDDPRKLIRRTVDVAVDETLALIAVELPDELRQRVAEATAPLKMGLRCAFELGSALAENGGAYAAADQGKLALRVAQAGLEEMQRFVFERAVEFASRQLAVALRDLPFDDAAWNASLHLRQTFANRLRALPDDPLEASDENRLYWKNLVNDAATLAGALSRSAQLPSTVGEPLAIVWAGAQLLMKSVERISVAAARASAIGAPAVGTTQAFDGELPSAPAPVRKRINATLGRGAAAAVRQADAVEYLLRVVGARLHDVSAAAANVLTLLTGRPAGPAAALSMVLSNLGAFAPGADGRVNAQSSLEVLRDGLRAYVNGRLDSELLPQLRDATRDKPELVLYLDEVLLSTLRTVVDTVFDAVLTWQSGSGDTQRALRELCSSLVMRVFGRSLVVTGDVILAHALGLLQAQLRDFAANANRDGSIAPMLAGLTGLDRALVADLVTETLEVCAETFAPMPDERRARMRDLMYQMIDTTPPAADASTLESLKAAGMVGNVEAALELAQFLGEEIAANLMRFIGALLTRVAAALLALLQNVIADIQQAIDTWVQGIEALAVQLLGQLGDLVREIGRLQHELDVAVDAMLAQASLLLGGFAGHGGSRNSLRTKLRNAVAERALDALAGFPGYGALPVAVRRVIKNTVRQQVNHLFDEDIFNPVLDALEALAGQTTDLLDDLRAIEPGDDLAVAIADIALDRIEDALRAAFGGDPGVRIRFDAPLIGEIDLGRVHVPIASFVAVARGAIRALERFDAALAGAVGAFTTMLDAESALDAAQAEHAAAQAIKDEAEERIAETRDGALDLVIVEPQPASAKTGPVQLRLRIAGGSAAMLAGDGLSHRRLFVWVNDTEMALDGVHAELDLRLASGSSPGLPGFAGARVAEPTVAAALAPHSRGNSLARARAQRHDALHREHLSVRVTHSVQPRSSLPRPPGAGGVARFAGDPLPRLPDVGFPPRVAPRPALTGETPDSRPALIVTLDVPPELLHEGINAIACTLVPGSAARRMEQSVSFLHGPSAQLDPAAPTMPLGRIAPALPQALSELLRRRGAAANVATLAQASLREVRGATWVAPLTARKRGIAAARKRLQKELAATAAAHVAIGEAISKRALRPVIAPALAARRRKEKAL